jgi:pimeloyl-ACP methyl ester carboxylesterase
MSAPSLINYSDTGSGIPVVFLHGFCESKEFWNDFKDSLSSKFRIICPDLPGFGESPLRKKEITIEYMADKVHDLLNHLGIDKCIMIGHSMGGYVTLAFAEQYAESLTAIGLFHSTAFPDSQEKRKARNKTIEFIEKHGPQAFADSFVAPLFYEPNRQRLKETIEWLKSVVAGTSPEGIIAAVKAMRDRKNRTEVLSNIKVPVLFIIGEQDSAVPLDASLEQASMPNKAVKHVLSGCGHMGMFEKPEETLKIVEDFLSVVG